MSRKTEFKGTAASRRRARRANLQSQEAISSDKASCMRFITVDR